MIYAGVRGVLGQTHVIIEDGDAVLPLPHVVYHSPDGFEWGYAGSGPHDLALSILAHHAGFAPDAPALRALIKGMPWQAEADDEAAKARRVWAAHNPFCTDVVARFESRWAYTSAEIDDWYKANAALLGVA